jgi:hypothetical protein
VNTIISSPPLILPDYVQYLICLDVKWYCYLKDAVRQAIDGYMVVMDVIEKNREKVENPKGSGEGGLSMF